MKKIFCFGNDFFSGDEVGLEIGRILSKQKINFEFIIANSPNDILSCEDELIILDVAKGIKEVQLLTDIEKLENINSVSCHDLDLSFYLKLLKNIGKINLVKIIAIPYGINNYNLLEDEIKKKLGEL